jgi:nitrilase
VIDHTPRAASFFIDPTGEVISEVLQDEEGSAYAEIDLSRSLEPKQFHDVVRCYNRFDILICRSTAPARRRLGFSMMRRR